ncbi:MAG: uroporphyrinogen-III synthase [Campylobacterales bacterium]
MSGRPVVLLSPTPCAGAIHLPAIETEFVHETAELAGCDAVIFTSKQAVAALEKSCHHWKSLKLFSVGEGTSRAIAEAGGTVFYEATNAYGDILAEEIVLKYPGFKYFYPRAETVVSDLENILKKAGVRLRSQTLYRTRCRAIDESRIPENAAIVFTAPSTVNCFFKQVRWRRDWIAVAIGDRTAQALGSHIACYVSPAPLLEASVTFAASL